MECKHNITFRPNRKLKVPIRGNATGGTLLYIY